MTTQAAAEELVSQEVLPGFIAGYGGQGALVAPCTSRSPPGPALFTLLDQPPKDVRGRCELYCSRPPGRRHPRALAARVYAAWSVTALMMSSKDLVCCFRSPTMPSITALSRPSLSCGRRLVLGRAPRRVP